jgi:hypothetical protein
MSDSNEKEPTTDSVWRAAGQIDFDSHGGFWSSLPDEPGLYRLKFGDRIFYVGQAKSVFRRLGDYYQPGQGVESDHRIHRALHKYGGAVVEVMTGAEFSNSSVRHRRESFEIEALRTSGMRVLNGKPDCVENLQDRIEYHADEIKKLEEKIATLTAKPTMEEM